jgi:hypothetical protein
VSDTFDIHTGHCSCGAVRFKTRGNLRGVIYCHCGQCRRQTGHFLAATAAEDVDLEVEGVDAISWFQSSPEAKRGFCSICGSGLFWKNSTKSYTSILAGTFDEPSGLKAEAHIFVGDKGCYYEICDGLPQHVTAPSGFVSTVSTES